MSVGKVSAGGPKHLQHGDCILLKGDGRNGFVTAMDRQTPQARHTRVAVPCFPEFVPAPR